MDEELFECDSCGHETMELEEVEGIAGTYNVCPMCADYIRSGEIEI